MRAATVTLEFVVHPMNECHVSARHISCGCVMCTSRGDDEQQQLIATVLTELAEGASKGFQGLS